MFLTAIGEGAALALFESLEGLCGHRVEPQRPSGSSATRHPKPSADHHAMDQNDSTEIVQKLDHPFQVTSRMQQGICSRIESVQTGGFWIVCGGDH